MRVLVLLAIIAALICITGCPNQSGSTATLVTKTVTPVLEQEIVPEWELGNLALFAAPERVVAIDEVACNTVWAINMPGRVYDYKIRQRIKAQDNDYALVTWIDQRLRPWTALLELSTELNKTKLVYAFPDVVPIDSVPTTDYLFTVQLEFEQLNGLELGTINAVSIVNGAQKSYNDLFMPIAEATPSQPTLYQPNPKEPGNLILIGSAQPSEASVSTTKSELKNQEFGKNITNNNSSSPVPQDTEEQTNENSEFDKLLRSLLPIEELTVASLSTVDAELNYKKLITLPKKIANISVLTLVDKYLLFSGLRDDELHTALFAIDVSDGSLAWFKEFEETLVVYIVPGDLAYRVPFDYSNGRFLIAWITPESDFELTSIELKTGKTVDSRLISQDSDQPSMTSILSVWYVGRKLNAADRFSGAHSNWTRLDLPQSNIYWDPRYGTLNNPPMDLSIKTKFWGRARLTDLGTGKALKVGRHWIDPFNGSVLNPDLSLALPEELNLQTFFPGSYFVERQVGELLLIRRYGIPLANEFAQTDNLFMIYSTTNHALLESDFTSGLQARYNSQYGLVINNRTMRLFDQAGEEKWKSDYDFDSGYSAAMPKK